MVEVIKSHFCPHNSQSQNELDTLYFSNLQFHLMSKEESVGQITYLYLPTSILWRKKVSIGAEL